jgi:nicotinamide-nucleotide amidase
MADSDKKIIEVVRRVYELFVTRGLTLSLAESCTGGLISHYLTALPGASAFFRAGVVSYSEDMKKKILGVSSDIIVSYGVVSEQTAKEMAEKVRLLTGTDISISTTGNLGPDVLEGKEKGLIYIAASKEGRIFVKELRLRGNREENKEEAALKALSFLIEIAKG